MTNRLDAATAPRRVKADLLVFAARMRAGRAVLGWSQTELGKKAQITQRAINRLEAAAVKARHLTQIRIDAAFKNAGIEFVELANGGFEMIVADHVLTKLLRQADARTHHLRNRRDAA
jgi:predicted transcriptional regulator